MRRAATAILALLVSVPATFAHDEPDPDDTHRSAANLRELCYGVIDFMQHHARFPPAAVIDPKGKPLLSWRVAILPHLGEKEKALYKQFKLNEAWDSPHNKALLKTMPQVYAPVGVKTKEPYMTVYQVFVGKGTVFDDPQGMILTELTDGTSPTLMIVEAGEPVPWTKPQDLSYDPKKTLPKLGGLFRGDFNAACCDGSVRFIKKSVEERVLRAAITRNGGEAFELDDLGLVMGR